MRIQKLIVISIFFFYILFGSLSTISFAQGLPAQIPGQDCGVAGAPPPKNKCCTVDPSKPPSINAPGAFSIVVDIIQPLISAILSPFYLDVGNQTKNNYSPCTSGVPSASNSAGLNCNCIEKANTSDDVVAKLCNNLENNDERSTCRDCMTSKNETKCIWTGLGSVKTNLGEFIGEKLLTWGIGVAGGVAMLCIMYAAFMMQTSGGNAEQVKKAQQMLTSCITGLMLILFSVFILKLIGVDILKIPSFK